MSPWQPFSFTSPHLLLGLLGHSGHSCASQACSWIELMHLSFGILHGAFWYCESQFSGRKHSSQFQVRSFSVLSLWCIVSSEVGIYFHLLGEMKHFRSRNLLPSLRKNEAQYQQSITWESPLDNPDQPIKRELLMPGVRGFVR